MKKRILLVGPINDRGLGGRFEEMKVWSRFLEEENLEVSVFSMFNSQFGIGKSTMIESAQLAFPIYWKFFPRLREILLRVWGSKLFRKKRERFYYSTGWEEFAGSFQHIILFITHQSKELRIFDSDLPVPISLRFTGTVQDFSYLTHHKKLIINAPRNYVIHGPSLFRGFENNIVKFYIDQTTLAEKSLLELDLRSNLNVFAMVGLFMEVKQMGEIISLFAKLPHFTLILFGTGDLQSSYQDQIVKLGLSNVKIGGFVAPENISELYSQIDALIINSSEETGPMTGIEAMAAGKIIFSRSVGVMPDRLSGFELIYEDLEDLSKKIKEYSELSAEKIIEIKSDIRNRYLDKYSNAKLKMQIKNMMEKSIRK